MGIKALELAIKALEQQPSEDCISRTEAIKALQKVPCSLAGVRIRFILSIKDLPSVTPSYNSIKTELEQTRWIPVSERLPKADEYIGDVAKYYLVQNEYGDMLVARYTHGEYWEQIYQLKPIADKIVAWMPLPQPYKAESEDKE